MREYRDDDIVIVGAKRSIMGSAKGSIKEVEGARLAYHVLEDLLTGVERGSEHFKREMIKKMIIGQAVQAGTGQSLPRQIAHLCSLPPLEAALTINELCGSSMESLIMAIHSLRLGEYPLVIAGGVETLSLAPYILTEKELLERQEEQVEELMPTIRSAALYDALWCRIADVHTIVHAENVTARWVERAGLKSADFKVEIDRYAALSNERALEAAAKGLLREEIAAFPGSAEQDELPKAKDLARMARRQGTRYTPEGLYLSSHNSPPPANCAALLLLTTGREARKLKLHPLGRINSYSRAATPYDQYLLAPVEAIMKMVKQQKRKLNDYELMELNSAYGSQIPIIQRELDLDMERVNIYGDSLAYGHPIGAAGARLVTTLLYALRRERKGLGLATICMGGGNAIGMEIEVRR